MTNEGVQGSLFNFFEMASRPFTVKAKATTSCKVPGLGRLCFITELDESGSLGSVLCTDSHDLQSIPWSSVPAETVCLDPLL